MSAFDVGDQVYDRRRLDSKGYQVKERFWVSRKWYDGAKRVMCYEISNAPDQNGTGFWEVEERNLLDWGEDNAIDATKGKT